MKETLIFDMVQLSVNYIHQYTWRGLSKPALPLMAFTSAAENLAGTKALTADRIRKRAMMTFIAEILGLLGLY